MRTEQIRGCQGCEKLGRCVVAMRNSTQCIFINCVLKNDGFVSERDLAMSKNINCLLLFSQLSFG